MSEFISLPFDYHSHNRRCGHAVGELHDYVQQASVLGFQAFGLSDHIPAYFLPGDHPLPHIQMALSELPHYVAEAQTVQQERRGQVEVLIGIEADYVEDQEAQLSALLNAHPFDYVLGSVHYALGKTIFRRDWAEITDPEPIFTEYYRLVARAAQSGLFDILSHLTAIEAYSPPLAPELADFLYLPVADAVAVSGCVVEINTSGYRKMRAADGGPGEEPFPNRRMLRLLLERGVPLTFGSDCHHPDEVGYGQAKVAALLHEFGISTSRFQKMSLPRASKRGGEATLNILVME